MKHTFTRKTVYGNQVFLAGKTYDLPKRDLTALGVAKAAKSEATASIEEDKTQSETTEVVAEK